MSRLGDIAERLAAVRAPKGMLAVRLSAVPNHDFNPGSHEYEVRIRPTWKTVRGLVEANRACLKFIDDNSLGGGNWPGGLVVDDEGNEVAQVSYNGRVWEPGEYPTPEIDARRWDMERASGRRACETCGCGEVKADSLVAPMSAEEKDAEAGPKEGPPATAQPLRARRDYGASREAADWKKKLLDDYEEWSGGWGPGEQEVGDVKKYIKSTMPMWAPKGADKFLLDEQKKGRKGSMNGKKDRISALADRVAAGKQATTISATARKVIEAWMDGMWTTAEDSWRVEARRNLKLVSVKEAGGEEGTYEFATKVTYGKGYEPEEGVIRWTVRVDQFPKT